MPGTRVEVEVGFERYYAVAARTFAEVRRGDIVLYEDAYRNIALAINQGNAAEMFGASVGQELRLSALDVRSRRLAGGRRAQVRAFRRPRRRRQARSLALLPRPAAHPVRPARARLGLGP